MKEFSYYIFYTALLFLVSHSIFSQRIRVVNMIPQIYSDERYRDAEPNLAVNPANPKLMAATAFTPEPMVGDSAPVFYTLDGGRVWHMLSVIPGGNPANTFNPLFDITIRFGGSGTYLYASTLRGDVLPGSSEYPKMNVLRIKDFLGSNTVEKMSERGKVDQPYIQVATVMGGSERTKDKVYVGNNDKFSIDNTATIDFFANAGTLNGSISDAIDEGAIPPGNRFRNLPAIRTAIHPSGVAYAVFYRINMHSPQFDIVDVIVVRDDNWAAGSDIFRSLNILGESSPGQKVIINREVVWNYLLGSGRGTLGNNRLTGSNLSIAVDPNNPGIVYVAWADKEVDSKNTLHIRSSFDSGQTWSDTDLLTVSNATNPALAVNTNGKIGFLYQKLSDNSTKWETHLRRSNNRGNSWPEDNILSSATWDHFICQPDCPPSPAPGNLYLGDYLHLMAVGKDFYGVFSASNYPDRNNFPDADEVIYQREHDFENKKLYSDAAHIPANEVPVSIDPFFFHVTELDSTKDFYVRDYTNSATDFDEGLEPSVEPRFCKTPDVWNRRSNAAGGFSADDQPLSEDPWQHPQRNFAFARVHRKQSGIEQRVKLHYLFSEFGTGSNYVPAGTVDPEMTFLSGDIVKISDGYEWTLPASSSNHTCLAVEISTVDDPIISPSLENHTPGWSNGTDLMVINDNNKAQRNMNVYSIVENSEITTSSYAIVHNPGLYEVTAMKLWYKYKFLFDPRISLPGDPPLPFPEQDSILRKNVAIAGGDNSNYSVTDSSIVLFNMKPGESRFVKISNPFAKGQKGQQIVVDFDQVRNDVIINGFTVVQDYVSLEKAAEENIRYNASVFGRIHAIYPTMDTAIMVKNNDLSTLKTRMDSKGYADYLARNLPLMKSIVRRLTGLEKNDPFELTAAMSLLHKQLEEKDSSGTAAAHLSLLNAIDAYLTYLQLQKGNIADILQTMYLQREIFRKINAQGDNESARKLITASEEFISRFEKREWSTNDYPGKVEEILSDFEAYTVSIITVNRDGLINSMKLMKEKLNDARELQGAHIKFLLMLREITEQ